MKKNLLVATSTAALLVAASVFVACSGDDSGVVSTEDAGSDSGTSSTDSGMMTVVDSGPSTTDSGPVTTKDSGTVDSGPKADSGTADSGQAADSGPVDSGTPDAADAAAPPAPQLGTVQIDRMGRPAVNTALNHVFDADAGAAGAAKDAYNADKNVSAWPATYVPEFAGNLAVLDALDTGLVVNAADGGLGGCGNQALYNSNPDAGNEGYVPLAGLLATDVIFLNSAGANCTQYLGVELAAVGAIPAGDCGGRTLTYDTIQTTYSLAAFGGVSGFSSGVTATPTTKTPSINFPYFHTPL